MARQQVRKPTFQASRIPGPWGQGRRLEFIDFRLRWEGKLNRSDLIEQFGISVPQASTDIANYIEVAPGNLSYDRSARVYVATPGFAPAFTTSDAEHYLNDMLALSTGVLGRDGSFVGWSPDVAIAATPARSVPEDILVNVVQAIRKQGTVEVLYQSMSHPEPVWREISPHALGHDGLRWHARAYCHKRGAFRDFVFARMLQIRAVEGVGMVAENDSAWTAKVNLILVPKQELSVSRRRVIELDYAMSDGQVVMKTRHAMLYYVLQRLGLNRDGEVRSEALQIQLKNVAEVKAILDGLAKSYD